MDTGAVQACEKADNQGNSNYSEEGNKEPDSSCSFKVSTYLKISFGLVSRHPHLLTSQGFGSFIPQWKKGKIHLSNEAVAHRSCCYCWNWFEGMRTETAQAGVSCRAVQREGSLPYGVPLQLQGRITH